MAQAGTRLAAYGALLVVTFGGAYLLGDALVPDGVVAAWTDGRDAGAHGEPGAEPTGHAGATPTTEPHAPSGSTAGTPATTAGGHQDPGSEHETKERG